MSDDKKRIADLEKRMLELHEKLEDAQDDKATAEKEAAEAKKSVKKKDWFSAPMLTAYLGVFGVLANFANDIRADYIQAQAKVEEKQKNTTKDMKTGSAVIAYVDHRMEDMAGTCALYFDAVVNSMPPYQVRKVDRFIEEAEMGLEHEEPVDEGIDVGSLGSIGRGAGAPERPRPTPVVTSTPVPEGSVDDRVEEEKVVKETAEKPIRAAAKIPDNVYGDIFQQLEDEGEVDVEDIIKKRGKRARIKRNKK